MVVARDLKIVLADTAGAPWLARPVGTGCEVALVCASSVEAIGSSEFLAAIGAACDSIVETARPNALPAILRA
jgi:hydroxyethylthiazole kinase-like sugar kinase family protein